MVAVQCPVGSLHIGFHAERPFTIKALEGYMWTMWGSGPDWSKDNSMGKRVAGWGSV